MESCFRLNDLPDEILSEILIKLPVKFVHRCKCVSKLWNSLISNPCFAQRYTLSRPKYSPDQFTLVCWCQSFGGDEEDLFKHPGFTFAFLPKFHYIYIFGSCNGLVLCGRSLSHPAPYFICNPLTMQWIEIPPPPLFTANCLIGFVCSNNSPEFASSTTYNVVLIPKLYAYGVENPFKVEIFSFDTLRWSVLQVYCGRQFSGRRIGQDSAVCCNGVMYWLVNGEGILEYDVYNKIDQCRVIDLPKAVNTYFCKTELIGICQDFLRFSQLLFPGPGNPSLEVWELRNSERSEWSLEYDTCIQDLVVDGGTIDSIPIHQVAIDAIDRDVVYVIAQGCVLRFNLKNRTLESNLLNATRMRLSPKDPLFVLPWWPTPLPTHQPLQEN